MVKAVNVLKIISALFFLATILFVYAFLPVMVNVNPDSEGWSIHKEYFFYAVLAGFIVLNIFLLILERILIPLLRTEEIQAWVKGLGFVLNFYLAFLVGYIGVINNQLSFGAGSYAYLNYLGPLLILVWILGLLFLSLQPKKTT